MGRRRTEFQSAIRNPKSAIGFTLVELLVVIGIIVLLVGILLPVVNGVRKAAYAAASGQQIARLTSAIENYNSEYRAYPGPLSNEFIVTGSDPGGKIPKGLEGEKVTMSENLVLGLLGGLKLNGSDPEYDAERIRNRLGPMSLNPVNPKGGRSYIDVSPAELSLPSDPKSAVKYKAEYGGPEAADSKVPEFVDHFPDSLPVIYLRARKGAPGVISDGGKGPAAYQYDVQQYAGYVKPGGAKTGIGGNGPHGLREVGKEVLLTAADPPKPPEAPWGNGSGSPAYTAFTYFANPQISGSGAKNATGVPRQKDGYILISPGKDRVYGTRDDITNFGPVQ